MAFWPRKPQDGPEVPANGPANVPADGQSQQPAAAAQHVAPPVHQPAAQASGPAAASVATGGPAAPPPQLSPEQLKSMAEAAKRFSAAFGEIVSIFMRTPGYQTLPISELEWIVVPAVATGQFSLAEGQSKTNGMIQPVGVVMWARVSDEIDQRMTADPSQPLRLKPAEWTSGDKLWVMEALGDGRVIEAMLKRMMETGWAGRTVKFRAKSKDGKMVVATLPQPQPQSGSAQQG